MSWCPFLVSLPGVPGVLAGVLGTGLKAAQFATQIAAHAMAGGVISVMQGGKFGHGFVSAGATKAASPWIGSIGDGARAMAPARVATAALVGGTVSAATGGKFANGAVTAAFQQAWNGEKTLRRQSNTAPQPESLQDGQVRMSFDGIFFGEHSYAMASPQVCSFLQTSCTFENVFGLIQSIPVSGQVLHNLGAASVIRVQDNRWTGLSSAT